MGDDDNVDMDTDDELPSIVKLFAKKKVQENCKNVYDKCHFCPFCLVRINSKISRHILNVHRDHPRVSPILMLEKRSEKRRALLQQLENEGNFIHNIDVLREGNGNIVVGRRPTEVDNNKVKDYLPCEYCRKFIIKSSLWQHQKNCLVHKVLRPGNDEDKEKESLRHSIKHGKQLLESALAENDEAVLADMFASLQNGEERDLIKKDLILRRFCALKLTSLGDKSLQKKNDIYRVNSIGRTLAKLVLAAKKMDSRCTSLNVLLDPDMFDVVVRATTEVIFSNTDKMPLSLRNQYRNLLGHAVQVKVGLGLRRKDHISVAQAEQFQRILELEWKFRVGSVCNKHIDKAKRNRIDCLPTTEDVKIFSNFISQQLKNLTADVKRRPVPTIWLQLNKFTFLRLLFFSKRRTAEVSELKYKEHLERPKWHTSHKSEMLKSLNKSEQTMMRRRY